MTSSGTPLRSTFSRVLVLLATGAAVIAPAAAAGAAPGTPPAPALRVTSYGIELLDGDAFGGGFDIDVHWTSASAGAGASHIRSDDPGRPYQQVTDEKSISWEQFVTAPIPNDACIVTVRVAGRQPDPWRAFADAPVCRQEQRPHAPSPTTPPVPTPVAQAIPPTPVVTPATPTVPVQAIPPTPAVSPTTPTVPHQATPPALVATPPTPQPLPLPTAQATPSPLISTPVPLRDLQQAAPVAHPAVTASTAEPFGSTPSDSTPAGHASASASPAGLAVTGSPVLRVGVLTGAVLLAGAVLLVVRMRLARAAGRRDA